MVSIEPGVSSADHLPRVRRFSQTKRIAGAPKGPRVALRVCYRSDERNAQPCAMLRTVDSYRGRISSGQVAEYFRLKRWAKEGRVLV